MTITDPLWEVGLLLGAVSLPAYRGSGESRNYAVPIPYVVYRGEVLRLDDESIKGLFFSSEHLEIDTSMFVDLNDDDDARAGMPELDPFIFEVGPAVRLYFLRGYDAGHKLYLEMPVRAAVSGDTEGGLSLEYRGLEAKVNLFYENKRLLRNGRAEFLGGLGVAFADSDLTGYIYDVEDPYVTAGRPGFDSSAGYAGCAASASLLMRFTDWLAVRVYGRLDSLHGAAFEDSPLVSQRTAVAGGLAVFIKLWEADKRVPRM